MIVTVTPNPSIDHTIEVGALVPDAVHRAIRSSIEPSGKGVNVALALHHAGVPVAAVLPLGGGTGRQLRAHLDQHGLAVTAVPILGEIRTNVTVLDGTGATTKFNESGPRLSELEANALVAAGTAEPVPQWTVWAGSLPPGFTAAHLSAAIAATRGAGGRIALDCSGAALRTVLAGPRESLPHLIKPNTDELAELSDQRLSTLGDVVAAARRVLAAGVEQVLVSLGGAGAVLVDDTGAWHGWARVRKVVNTAGAGDALLAGYLAADLGPEQQLSSALRFGADAVEQPGTLLLTLTPDRSVRMGPADLSRRLFG